MLFRVTLPCALLAAFLLSGCGILQDMGSAQKGGISTPAQKAQAKQQAPAQQAPRPAPAPAMTAQPVATGAKVALLAPLSGKSAPLGQAMVNAAQLAVFDMGVTGFELMPRDTKGTPDGAVQAARDAIASGAQLLVGPLFAADVAAVKPVVLGSGINMLALSTDVSLATAGAYVMGFAPAPQVERVVAYAASRGARNFAAVLPAGPYGQLVSHAFDDAVRAQGGTVIAKESMANLVALSPKKEQIDALFLPFGGAELRSVAGQLAAAGFERSRTHLLGTGLWDEPNLAQGQNLLIGGWFAAPEPQMRARFIQSYKDTYGQEPPRLSTLAYDATALAAVMARGGAGYSAMALSNQSGFAGIDGIFRLTSGGQIERGLAVLEVGMGENVVVDPSPSSFHQGPIP